MVVMLSFAIQDGLACRTIQLAEHPAPGAPAQEVVGTDDSALQAVIAADAELMALREEEAQIQARLGGLGLDDAPAPSGTAAAPGTTDITGTTTAAAPNGKADAGQRRGNDVEDMEDGDEEDEDEGDDEEDEDEEEEEQHGKKEPERRKQEAAPAPEASTSAAADADGDRLAEIYERLAVRWLPSSFMRMLHLADTALLASCPFLAVAAQWQGAGACCLWL